MFRVTFSDGKVEGAIKLVGRGRLTETGLAAAFGRVPGNGHFPAFTAPY